MDVERLAVNYQVIEGGIGGGAPRFSIGVDTDYDGEVDGNVFVYLGDPPSFTESTGDAQFSGNLVTDTELRVDSTQLGGSFYGTFEDAVDLAGFGEVLYIDFVVDAGWSVEGGVQSIVVTDLDVNRDNVRLRKLAREQDR